MWQLVAVAALGAIKGIAAGGVKKAQAEANNRLSAAQAEVTTTLRATGNQAKAAENSLDLWSQSVNNARRQKAIGNALESQAVNVSRSLDQAVRGQFAGSVRDAEQAGAQASAAAAAGVEGSVVDRVAAATQLRRAVGAELSTRLTGQAATDISQRVGMLTSQLVSGLDTSTKMAGLDYNRATYQTQAAEGTMRSAIGGVLASGAVEMALGAASAGSTERQANMVQERSGGVALRERDVGAVGGGDLADFAFDKRQKLGDGRLSLNTVRLGGDY